MMRGDGDVVSGCKNKLKAAVANVTPGSILAEQQERHRPSVGVYVRAFAADGHHHKEG